jgi:hypothetical protein
MSEKKNFSLFIVLVSLFFTAGQVLADISTLNEGILYYDSNPSTGINATGSWANAATSLSWEVTNEGDYYHYEYIFTVPAKDISHLILQVSENFESDNMWNLSNGVSTEEPTDYDSTSNGKSNPGMPGTIYGIKFEPSSDSTTLIWSFDSDREPMWGDFYAKDGKDELLPALWGGIFGKIDVYAYSSHMDGGTGYIAVPDTNVVPVPSAIFLGIFGLSFAGVKLRKIT